MFLANPFHLRHSNSWSLWLSSFWGRLCANCGGKSRLQFQKHCLNLVLMKIWCSNFESMLRVSALQQRWLANTYNKILIHLSILNHKTSKKSQLTSPKPIFLLNQPGFISHLKAHAGSGYHQCFYLSILPFGAKSLPPNLPWVGGYLL